MITDCPYCTRGCTRCAAGMKSNDNQNTAASQPEPLQMSGFDAGIPTG